MINIHDQMYSFVSPNKAQIFNVKYIKVLKYPGCHVTNNPIALTAVPDIKDKLEGSRWDIFVRKKFGLFSLQLDKHWELKVFLWKSPSLVFQWGLLYIVVVVV